MTITLNKKLSEINRILFLQFIYNDFDDKTLNELLSKLKENHLYPFKFIKHEEVTKVIIYNTLRFFINKFPIHSRTLYLRINR